ncbi:MAG: hypothetical protein M3P49_06955 [Actinomycetota bacterium]|nr:hypothetical protein [Actinomycetota bacterium]
MSETSSSRPLLGVDLDNVLSASDAAMVEALERVTGRSLTAHAASSYEALAAGMISRDEVAEALEVFHAAEALGRLDIVPGAVEALQRLSEVYEIHVVTARPQSTRVATSSWLDARGMGDVIAGLHFANPAPGAQPLLGQPDGRPGKTELPIPWSAFVEDHLDTALAFARRGVTSCLLAVPWHAPSGGSGDDSDPDGLVRVAS